MEILRLTVPVALIRHWLELSAKPEFQDNPSNWEAEGSFCQKDSLHNETEKVHLKQLSLITSKENVHDKGSLAHMNLVLKVFQPSPSTEHVRTCPALSLNIYRVSGSLQVSSTCGHKKHSEIDRCDGATFHKDEVDGSINRRRGRPKKRELENNKGTHEKPAGTDVKQAVPEKKYKTRGVRLPLHKWGLTQVTKSSVQKQTIEQLQENGSCGGSEAGAKVEDAANQNHIEIGGQSSHSDTQMSFDHGSLERLDMVKDGATENTQAFNLKYEESPQFKCISQENKTLCVDRHIIDLELMEDGGKITPEPQVGACFQNKSSQEVNLALASRGFHTSDQSQIDELSSQESTMPFSLSPAGHTDIRNNEATTSTITMNDLILKVARTDAQEPTHTASEKNIDSSHKHSRPNASLKKAKQKKISRVSLERLPYRKRRDRNQGKCVPCQYCQKLFCDYTGVHDHVKKFHSNETDFDDYLVQLKEQKKTQCDQCKRTFQDRYALRYHQDKEHSDLGQLKCTKCSGLFDDPVRLRNHVRTAHIIPSRRFVCDKCPAAFKWRATLQAHELEVHKGIKEKACNLCGKVFHRQSQLNRHMRVHSADTEKLVCSICHSKFNFQANLKRHKTIVHGPQEEKFHCSYCGRGFAQKAGLWPHIQNMHFPMQEFPCSKCRKSFHHGQALKAHMAKVHNQKDFKLPKSKPQVSKYLKSSEDLFYCSACKEAFYYKSLLFEHMHTAHANAFPFQCKECPQGFLERSFLINHKQKAHKVRLTSEEAILMKHLKDSSRLNISRGQESHAVHISHLSLPGIESESEDAMDVRSFPRDELDISDRRSDIDLDQSSSSTNVPNVQYDMLVKYDSDIIVDDGNSNCEIGYDESRELALDQLEEQSVLVNDGSDILVELASIDGQNVEFVIHRATHVMDGSQ